MVKFELLWIYISQTDLYNIYTICICIYIYIYIYIYHLYIYHISYIYIIYLMIGNMKLEVVNI